MKVCTALHIHILKSQRKNSLVREMLFTFRFFIEIYSYLIFFIIVNYCQLEAHVRTV